MGFDGDLMGFDGDFVGFEWWTLAFIGIQKVVLLEHFLVFFFVVDPWQIFQVCDFQGELVMGYIDGIHVTISMMNPIYIYIHIYQYISNHT